LAAYDEFESRFGRVRKGRGSKTETVKNAIDRFVTDFSLTDIEKACPLVSRDMIRRVLFDLVRITLFPVLNLIFGLPSPN
jgi:hypothetical protein